MGVYTQYFKALKEIAKEVETEARQEYKQKLVEYKRNLSIYRVAKFITDCDEIQYTKSEEKKSDALQRYVEELYLFKKEKRNNPQAEIDEPIPPKTLEKPQPPKCPQPPALPRQTFLCMGSNDNPNQEGMHLIYERDDEKHLIESRCLTFETNPNEAADFMKDNITTDSIAKWRFSFFFKVPGRKNLLEQNIDDINQEFIRKYYKKFVQEVQQEYKEGRNVSLPIEKQLLRISWEEDREYRSIIVNAGDFFKALSKKGIEVLLDGEKISFKNIIRCFLLENTEHEFKIVKCNVKKLMPQDKAATVA